MTRPGGEYAAATIREMAPMADVAIGPTVGGATRRRAHKIAGGLTDGALWLLLVWMFPLAIILIGAPLVLLVRLALEIAERL